MVEAEAVDPVRAERDTIKTRYDWLMNCHVSSKQGMIG